MAVEGQELKKSYADAGVRVDLEKPLAAVVMKVDDVVAVRGQVLPALVGGGSKKRTDDWKVVKAE
jgi:hypothetical protein